MKTAVIYDKWLSGFGGGEVVTCNLAVSLRDAGYDVTLLSKDNVSKDQIRSKLSIDLTGVRLTNDLTLLNPKSKILNSKQLTNPKFQKLNNQTDLFINLSFMDYTYGIGKHNIYYVHFPSPIRSGLFNYVLLFFQKTNFQFLLPNTFRERINDRLRAGIYINMRKRIDSYQTVLANSRFTQKRIKKYWNKLSEVLYPPVTLISNLQPLIAKRNWICSVGRFFTLGHGKKQEIMIHAFKKLYDSNNLKYQITNVKSTNQIPNPKYQKKLNKQFANSPNTFQLHLIGGVGTEPSSLRFVEQLKEMAKGYPIFFHFNAPRKEVEEILLKSKMYWHAAGFGEDAEKNPIKFEHFGIAPVEAISAGCIPILFNGGGLPEIIKLLDLPDEKHLFNSIDELVSKSNSIINDTHNSLPITVQQTLFTLFSQDSFSAEFKKIIASD